MENFEELLMNELKKDSKTNETPISESLFTFSGGMLTSLILSDYFSFSRPICF
jgi:hypothetical protein